MLQNFITPDDPLNLDNIRTTLTRLEDTIIFGRALFLINTLQFRFCHFHLACFIALIERAQFALNPRMYERGAFKELVAQGFDGTWLEWFLKETETFHGQWDTVMMQDLLSYPLIVPIA